MQCVKVDKCTFSEHRSHARPQTSERAVTSDGRQGPNHGESVQQAFMYAHSVQGLNRLTASYLAALECEEKTSWWGCSVRNECSALLHRQALASLFLAFVALCVARTMVMASYDFNPEPNSCATKKASALKSGHHTENEKHVVWNLYQTLFAGHTRCRAVITLMDQE